MADTCCGCGKVIEGDQILYTTDARPICAACNDRTAVPSARPPWLGVAIAGAVVGVVPWFIHVSTSSSETVNGQLVKLVYRDWIAVGCGVGAALFGLAAAWLGRQALVRVQAIGAGIVLLALGGYQVARGVGVFAAQSADQWSPPTQISEPIVTPPPAPAIDPTKPETCPDQDTCFQLGLQLEKANDLAGAATAYERSCDRGAAGGCFNAGLNAKKRTPPDLAAAFSWYQKGCKLGDLDSCNSVGQAHRGGRGVPQDLAKATAVFADACDHGGGFACINLALMLHDGEGNRVDLLRAFELFVKACTMDSSEELALACAHAGAQALEGQGAKRDVAEAVRYFQQACDRSAAQCHNLAVVTEAGTGVSKDLPKARTLYRRACDAGNTGSCNNLGHLENEGLGGPKDRAAAKALFKQACDDGVTMGCDNLKAAK